LHSSLSFPEPKVRLLPDLISSIISFVGLWVETDGVAVIVMVEGAHEQCVSSFILKVGQLTTGLYLLK